MENYKISNLKDLSFDESLQNFYKTYSRKKIDVLYDSFDKNEVINKIIKRHQSSAIFKIKNDVLEMYPDSTCDDLRALFLIIGYYFDNYDNVKKCVYTSNPEYLKKFFEMGLTKFRSLNFNITFDIAKEDANDIVRILLDGEYCDSELFDRLCVKFKKIKNTTWSKYKLKIETEYQKDCEARHIEEVTSMDLPTDWSNIFANDKKTVGVFAESVSDGLILSLNNLGRVDIEYISQITGEDCKNVINGLRGSIYQNPEKWDECFYQGFETADEYLSGRVVEKWKIAKEANEKYKGFFKRNVEALEQLIPSTIDTKDIYVTLGSPWIPVDIIDEFIIHLFGKDWPYNVKKKDRLPIYRTKHDVVSGTWEVCDYWKQAYTFANTYTYGTQYVKGVRLLEQALNMKIPSVSNEKVTSTGVKSILNEAETLLARDKQKKIIEEFKNWIWKDEKRKEQLINIYYDLYCSNTVRRFDGSFLQFPEMNKHIQLYDYQKNAVARIMFSPNTLLAHDVGAGKTYVMIAAGMEKKRIGLSKKNLYVVPNNLVGQWEELFKLLYPDSNICCIDPKKFTPSKRYDILNDIKKKNYDGIIMAYSSFSMIPLSKQFYINKINNEIKVIKDRLKIIKKSSKDYIKRIEKLKLEEEKLKSKLAIKDNIIYFDELKINSLFIDEAHNFKNLPIETKSNRVLGVSFNGSKKCEDMLDKVHSVQKNNNGGGIVFATGTPITNSITDIYAMQKYLQNGELSLLNLQSFDSWIAMFAEKELNFEIDVDTNNYRMATRFSKFHNLPELSIILSMVTDFHMVDKKVGIPELDSYKDMIVKKSKEFDEYLKEISNRADDVRSKTVHRKDDNMLKITSDGRKAALDMRLVNPKLPFNYESKVFYCANNVRFIYQRTNEQKSTQLVFCDISTPKKGFNIYDSLKELLILMEIPSDEIAYIHDAVTETERMKLFKKVQTGDIRILIGSTAKLGLGVNVQNKLVALHHLDLPWRPSDMIQREGRILRKGNENATVEIYRYTTDGSFDAYSWQLLEAKQKMIRDILSGSMPKRMCEEIDDIVLNYAEVKALAIGNPLLKERVEIANELSRLYTLQKKFIENHQKLEVELLGIPLKIKVQEELIENAFLDSKFYKKNKKDYSNEERIDIRRKIFKSLIDQEMTTSLQCVCEYHGFDIIIPNNNTLDKMHIYIERNGHYTIDIGSSEIGMMIRIDNFLEGFEKFILSEREKLHNLFLREEHIKNELEKKDSYSDKIQRLQKKLKLLDKKLGVKNE